ncbi:AP-3 complex subunit beta-1 [Pseudolycoriella hygida]|uniref:AP-3 complex subunit beta n=1 Tax=Pseudolycoriella hygida TaxID=35572 RepID=A0A9Q0MNF7_9DIPT|nr:AP-3 complex subunit beta-1 [Pseudolycoriella hygida]
MLSSGSTVSVGALSSYGNSGIDVGVEYASDPASGGFFHADYKKHDDLKQMLDSNKDSLKLEAMKRIIGMVAKGRDASELFPAVVKNVVSKNIEVKKLVYVYLVRYAEEQQDLALLSISTFQRALKDPNQLIRAGALRVLSSIRVSMIVPIVMLAIRDSASDMSPYVRKTAAHAIPKLYSLDAEQKDELISVIEKLLSDRTTLVVGSAVMAFEEVCPERVDLIHKNYRKLCNLLVDVDEWGQIIIINMLTRYARTQFTDPNVDYLEEEEQNKPFYDETSSSESENSISKSSKSPKKNPYTLDTDHRLLLRQTKPLLQSRNASVVMTVAQLYHHIAPRSEVVVVAKALIRLLRSYKEVQSVVLTCIASMSTQRKSIFEPYLKSFFVRTSDPTHIKLLKLDILTNLATETSISVILREFQTYISSNDKDFVAATIQAIGRCAGSIKEVTETCLSGLVHLLSNRDEYVVAESVVVIKKLLQTQAADHFEIISQMAKLLDFITVPAARASILWLIGEYNEKVPKIAPDVLRKLAKTFTDEEDIVKLQVLNLSVKLYLTNAIQTELLCQYIFNLARYDQNYDIRDRARFLKQFIFPASGQPTVLSRNARKIFLATKPAPLLESKYQGREEYQLGSLSHYLNMKANGYNDIPPFPEVAPDSSVRNVESPVEAPPVEESLRTKQTKAATKGKTKSFYSESEKSSSEYSSDSEESDSESESVDENGTNDKTEVAIGGKKSSPEETEDSESDSSDSDDSSSASSSSDNSDEDDESSSSDDVKTKKLTNHATKPEGNGAKPEKSNLDLLLDLGDISPSGPIMTPSLGGFLTPMMQNVPSVSSNRFELVGPNHIPLKCTELINKVNGYGLGVTYRFTRAPHLFSSTMVSIELLFTNYSNDVMENIKIGDATLSPGVQLNEFAAISSLPPKATVQGTLGIDFNDSTQPVSFDILTKVNTCHATIKVNVGEFIRSILMSENVYREERSKLRGMNEHSATMPLNTTISDNCLLQQRIYEYANVASIPSSNPNAFYFAGQTLSSQSLVLITIEIGDNNATVMVNCEKMVVGSMLLNEIKAALRN